MPSKPAPKPKPKARSTAAGARSKPATSAKTPANGARRANGHANGTRQANGHYVNGHSAPGPGRPPSGAPGGAPGANGYLNAESIRRALLADQRRRPTLFDHLTTDQRRELADSAGLTPMQFLMSVMLDPGRYMDARIDAAKTLAPYFHRKMPMAIELPDHSQAAMDMTRLLALPRADRVTLLALLKRVGVDLAVPSLPMVELAPPAEGRDD